MAQKNQHGGWRFVFILVWLASAAGLNSPIQGKEPPQRSQLLLTLPAGCNTPDAMALLPDGNIILSMPNFNNLKEGSRLMKITPDNRVEKFLELPLHPVTGQPVGPLGVCVGPEGELYLADFQMTGKRQSRVLRITLCDGKPEQIEPVITGFNVSNAVICRDGHLYVSETQIDTKASPATSGVFRFSLNDLRRGPIALADDETKDPHLLAIIPVHDKQLPLGADGLCFDTQGNLYIGNFADGTVHRITFDANGAVKSNAVFARADFMKSADGLFHDPKSGVIYVADSRANAVQMVLPDGSVKTLAQNGDTDGGDGGMDQPCEVLLRGHELIVSNMDWPVPGCINQKYNPQATLSVIRLSAAHSAAANPAARKVTAEQEMFALLDAPLLFTKRHSYGGTHIYDTFYTWLPGGGIYVLENPSAPKAHWKIRPVIDATTPGTLGAGVYSHPELSWDATKLLFCFKGKPNGSTAIYEIGIDGRGLRQLTNPEADAGRYHGRMAGQHDTAPAYLPDGRIVFLSTRPNGLVPCNNTGVATLHVMNADGSDMHSISVNFVNEFDPSVLPDGRILYGRWEYVDKNALTIQSLWTMNPDGSQETALYANNMVFPEAILDARTVPNSQVVVGTLAKHNAPPRGSIGLVDARRGKNNPQAIINLEHPNEPTFDRGNSCEPWPLSEEVVLLSGRAAGQKRNALQMLDRQGRRMEILSDPDICLHSPMLVKSRPTPPVLPDRIDRKATTGRFFLSDIYRGMTGVKRGEVKYLRVIEETSRTSATHAGANPFNQTFLISSALAFSAKDFLGVVPVDENGSAYFEAPSGKALYFQALDDQGRMIQSMRSFVQAAPGMTRSCVGCHVENEEAAAPPPPSAMLERAPDRLQPESWGKGMVNYPTHVQPILDKHCVRCHGGAEGIAAGMDLSGGWTEFFNISYENLTNRRETQLTAYWIAGIDCMNGTAHWSSQLLPPRSHGSGAAPLAKLLVSGHDGRIDKLTRAERDLLMAWMDSNGVYHGTWDVSPQGCALAGWNETTTALISQMQSAGCLSCHGNGKQIAYFNNDWINLQKPEWSRILRAPLPAGGAGGGLGICRQRRVDPAQQRLRLLVNGYAHAVLPLTSYPRRIFTPAETSGASVVTFASPNDENYRKMLTIIQQGRQRALAAPRVDVPGAKVVPGMCRQLTSHVP